MTLTVCSTLVRMLLLTQQIQINLCNSFEKFLTRYERKTWNLTLKSVNLVNLLMRHILSSEWLFPESEKVNLIFHIKRPSNTSEVCSCLGLVTYCSKFIPNFTAITEPLRWLPHQKVCFIWNGELKSTLSKIKTFFSKAPVLLYFHLAFKTRIVADTSKQGLGAVLLQKNPANSFF